MTSLPETDFIKEAGGYSEDEAPKHAALTRSKTLEGDGDSSKETSLTKSSPAVLGSSRDEPRFRRKQSRPTRFLTRSLPVSTTEVGPIVTGGQPNEIDVEQEIAEQFEEQGTNCCSTAFKCYKNSAMKLRNSAFICIVQLLLSSIPVSSVFMGIIFAEYCPKLQFLPVFGAVVGIIGAIFMAVWMFVSYSNHHGMPCSSRQNLVFGAMCLVVLIMTIVDAAFVFRLSPVFDPTSTEYCDETFYKYAFYKEIATFVAMVLSAMLYLPGSRHTLCCHNCSMRSPPNAFYHSI